MKIKKTQKIQIELKKNGMGFANYISGDSYSFYISSVSCKTIKEMREAAKRILKLCDEVDKLD